jgi:hypothetical protein
MMTLNRKTNALKCSNNRTMRPIVHTSKIVARILRRRTERIIEDILEADQFGFRREKGAGNAIGMRRIITHKP